jgi:hypothetical protein
MIPRELPRQRSLVERFLTDHSAQRLNGALLSRCKIMIPSFVARNKHSADA